MPSRPWFAFYPSDWRGDTKLRSCSPVSRLVWLEMMGIAHEAEPYGYVLIAGREVAPEHLATIAAVTVRQVRAALVELEVAGVFSRNELGVPYSRRMVRDETTRQRRAAGGKDSLGNPNVPRPKDGGKDTSKDTLPPILQGHPQIPDTRDQRLETTTTPSPRAQANGDEQHVREHLRRPEYLTALDGVLKAARNPDALAASIRACGPGGIQECGSWAEVGKALQDLAAAGGAVTPAALRAFIGRAKREASAVAGGDARYRNPDPPGPITALRPPVEPTAEQTLAELAAKEAAQAARKKSGNLAGAIATVLPPRNVAV